MVPEVHAKEGKCPEPDRRTAGISPRGDPAGSAFRAMTSERPYREALGADPALRELERNAGSQFCPRAVGALVGK